MHLLELIPEIPVVGVLRGRWGSGSLGLLMAASSVASLQDSLQNEKALWGS